MQFITALVRDECGATAIEYGLIAALIGAASVAALSGLGTEFGNTMTTAGNAMAAKNAAA